MNENLRVREENLVDDERWDDGMWLVNLAETSAMENQTEKGIQVG